MNSSMLPLISPADKLIVSKHTKSLTNQIITFKKNSHLIAHRIIYIHPTKKYLITKGDNNPKHDGKIKPNQVLGKVTSLKRNDQTIPIKHLYLSQSHSYQTQLQKIITSLNKKGLQHIILKGLPVHLFINNSPPMRLYHDADILIHPKNKQSAKKILKNLKYQEAKDPNFSNSTQFVFYKDVQPHPIVIDLHLEPAISFTKIHHLNSLLPKNLQDFSNHLFQNTTIHQGFKILKPETLLLYLLTHLYHHNFNGAYRLQLIHDLISNKKINWKKFQKNQQQYNLQNFTNPGLFILKKMYHSKIPNNIYTPLSVKQEFIGWTFTHIFSPFNNSNRITEAVKRLLLLLALSPSPLWKKIITLLHPKTFIYFFATIKLLFSNIFKKFS